MAFHWKVENFSRFKNTEKVYSEPFVLGGCRWKICLFPKGNKQVGYFSIYLESVETANNYISNGWSRDLKFRLVVFNQHHSKMTITKESNNKFDGRVKEWGFPKFMSLDDLNDPQKGFLVKDVCIIGAEVCLLRVRNENQVSRAAIRKGQSPNLETLTPIPTLVCVEPIKHTDVELFLASTGELMDFRGLAQIEKAFVPLLEEVCSHHPSLIECQEKRSPRFTAWAFTALGRVLYFLKTRKVKDMNDLCCKDLQTLWKELQVFGFDLIWLEPHVQSTLRMKSYLEKIINVEKLKENVVALELEREKLKAKLVAAEVNLGLETKNLDAEKDMLKANGFQVNDFEAELGYGNWEAKIK